MKKTAIIFILALVTFPSWSQKKLNIKSWDEIGLEHFNDSESKYKSTQLPWLDSEDIIFSPSGRYMFIKWGSPSSGGGILVYNLKMMRVEKNFIVKPSKQGPYEMEVAVNPTNEMEIAIQIEVGKVIILPDWSTEENYVLSETKKAFRTDKRTLKIKAAAKYDVQMMYSADGKNLHIANLFQTLSTYSASDGSLIKKMSFSKKDADQSIVLGSDYYVTSKTVEVKKTSTSGFKFVLPESTLNIYDIKKGTVINTIKVDSRVSFKIIGDFYHKLSTGDFLYDPETNQLNDQIKKAKDEVYKSSKKFTNVYDIPGVDGFLINAPLTNTTFFLTESTLSQVYTPIDEVLLNVDQCFQISPNGQYFVGGQENGNQLYILKLY